MSNSTIASQSTKMTYSTRASQSTKMKPLLALSEADRKMARAILAAKPVSLGTITFATLKK